MAYNPISGIVPQFSTANNELASGYYLKFYIADTATPLSIATDAAAGTLLAKVKLNTSGYPISNPADNTTVFIPHTNANYRVVLYRTEADADNDTTGNAEWNIPNTPTGSLPATSSDSVTISGTTLQALNDYDRSPLFVDVDDFTAGALPHVITVPSGWNPGSASTRFWKLSTAGVVTSAVISATTSTTFTVNESLLSTDTLFIGDDVVRNIHDGDPADIRARLSVPSNAEALLVANSLQEIEDAGASAQLDARVNIDSAVNPSIIASFVGSPNEQTYDLQSAQSNIILSTASGASVWTTVGRTGSGAAIIWSELDAVPVTAKYIRVKSFKSGSNVSGVSSFSLRARPKGSVLTVSDEEVLMQNSYNQVGGITVSVMNEFTVPLGTDGEFQLYWSTSGGTSPSGTFRIILVSFGEKSD